MSKKTRFDLKSACVVTLAHIWPALVGAILLVVLHNVIPIQADGPNQVGLVVVHGDGSVLTRCIEFDEDQISGYDVLDRSGLDFNVDLYGGMGSAICRIDNEGCTAPQEPCFCQCVGGGSSCIYWSYWHSRDGSWQYSGTGASSHIVNHGDLEGWVWGLGTISEATPPPQIAFDEICALPTSTATPTHTPVSTPTPTPTDTPEPTNTPNPPDIAYFNADRDTINAGESVTLSWDLSGAEAAYLRHAGGEEGVVAPGNKTVSPATTTVYTLIARSDQGETTAEVTINVVPVTHAPPATDTPPPTSQSAAAAASPPSATPASTSTPSPESSTSQLPAQPTDTPPPPLEPTVTPLPTPLPAASVVPSATPTPASVAAVTPPLDIQPRSTPPSLVRDTPQESGPNIPVLVLGGVGIIALLSGMAGMALLLLAIRQGSR